MKKFGELGTPESATGPLPGHRGDHRQHLELRIK
jgi:hypothetical protein